MIWTAIARAQGGVIGRRQLLAAGVRPGTVDTWLRLSRLEATSAQGVYRVAGAPVVSQSLAWVAALGTHSPLSYLSAARWWGMADDDDGLVHITRLDRRRLDWPTGVRVHRVGLRPADVTEHRGLPVTTRVETVLDCVGWLSPGRGGSLADRAVQQGWLTPAHVAWRLEHQPGRWGNRRLRRLLASLGDGAAAESERRLHRLLRASALTGWVANLEVVVGTRTFVIDVAFPQHRVAIEVDGFAYHSAGGRFQADRTRQNALIASGWRVLRFTWADIVERPAGAVAEVRALLAA
jgi:very-short-patch-repair endonuclease